MAANIDLPVKTFVVYLCLRGIGTDSDAIRSGVYDTNAAA